MRLDILQSIEPKKGCKHCNGRGVIGFTHDGKQPVFCQCIVKRYREELGKRGTLIMEGGKLVRK